MGRVVRRHEVARAAQPARVSAAVRDLMAQRRVQLVRPRVTRRCGAQRFFREAAELDVLESLAATLTRADMNAEHDHNRPRKVADEEAEEPPQAHDYRIGRSETAGHPSRRNHTRFTPSDERRVAGPAGATWVGSPERVKATRSRALFA